MKTSQTRHNVRTRSVAVAVFLAFVLSCSPVLSPALAEPARGAEGVGFTELTPELRKGVEAGLAYLASVQEEDGSFGASRYGSHVGITSLGVIAFLADGHVPGRGKYGDTVERGVDFILNHCTQSGLIAANTSHGPMYGHGFATLLLGEVYGMTGDERVREPLLKAVKLIVNTQNHEGGWRYQPWPHDADISVTICQVMALRSARNAGISVPKETIDKAIEYVNKCQNNSDGGFRYMLNSGGSAFPRSAAGVAALYYAGVYDGPEIEKGLDYLRKSGMPDNKNAARVSGHYFYGHYYAAQAMYLAGGEHWAGWFPAIRDDLMKKQQGDGRWSASHGDAYGTAMACIILQIPNRLLPIFQR